MVLWLGRSGLGWFCFGVSCFGESLDSTGKQAFSPFSFPVALLLLRFQRNLHDWAGPAPTQAGSFPIRPVGGLTSIRKSKTRTLSRQATRYTTTGTSLDSMMRWSDVIRRRRLTRAVATMARSAGSRRPPNEATSAATSCVNGRIWKTWLCKSSNNSSSGAFNPSLPALLRTAISSRLIALSAIGSVRRTAASSTRTCSRDSFLGSVSHRTTMWVSRSR